MLVRHIIMQKIDGHYEAEYNHNSILIRAKGNGQFEVARKLQTIYNSYYPKSARAGLRRKANKGGR